MAPASSLPGPRRRHRQAHHKKSPRPFVAVVGLGDDFGAGRGTPNGLGHSWASWSKADAGTTGNLEDSAVVSKGHTVYRARRELAAQPWLAQLYKTGSADGRGILSARGLRCGTNRLPASVVCSAAQAQNICWQTQDPREKVMRYKCKSLMRYKCKSRMLQQLLKPETNHTPQVGGSV